MAITLMLMMEGKPTPTAIQVTETTFHRFKYLEKINPITDPNIPDLIIEHDIKRGHDFENLSDDAQVEFIDLWCSELGI